MTFVILIIVTFGSILFCYFNVLVKIIAPEHYPSSGLTQVAINLDGMM